MADMFCRMAATREVRNGMKFGKRCEGMGIQDTKDNEISYKMARNRWDRDQKAAAVKTSGRGYGRQGGYGKADGVGEWKARSGRNPRITKAKSVVRGTKVYSSMMFL